MKNKFIIIISVLLGMISCKDEPKEKAVLSPLTIISNKTIPIKLTQIINIGTLNIKEETATVDASTPFVLKQQPSKIIMSTLLAKDTLSIFFINPNKEQKIKIEINNNNKVNFVFDKEDYLNNYTNNFHRQILPLMRSTLNQKPFFELIKKTEDKLVQELNEIKSNLDSETYKTLLAMVRGKMAHIKFMHSDRLKPLDSEDSYFDFVDNFSFDNDNYLIYSDNINTVLGVIEKQYDRKYKSPFEAASSEDKFNFVAKSIKSQELKSAILCFLASRIIPEQTESEKEQMLKQLTTLSMKEEYLQHIKAIKASTATGKKIGNKAKYLESLIPYKKDFSIKQLEGKFLFIDNWATWCGPCIKSMHSFKEKQQTLTKKEDVIYVFVSFDRNENIWRKYIEKSFTPHKQIVHLYNGSDMNSAYSKYYNISELPAYFVINNQGLIHDTNPKTPSEIEFEEYINKLK